ncbi:MAG: hypothetical protein KY460_11655 [Actinobacteria bacterium]|nr:hypothetical protein [Actinomycetota bacterium]
MPTTRDATTNGGGALDTPARLLELATPMVRQVLRTPGLGPTRELQASVAALLEAGWDVGVAGIRYATIVARIWGEVAAHLLTDAPSISTDPATALDPRKLLAHFYEVAEEHFAEAFASQDYIAAQADLGTSALTYRVVEQPIAQRLLHLLHAASLTDVDAAHRNVADLNRTMRELRRRVRALERQVAAERAATTPADDTDDGGGT